MSDNERGWQNEFEETWDEADPDTEQEGLESLIEALTHLRTPPLSEEEPEPPIAMTTTTTTAGNVQITIRTAKKTVAEHAEQILYRKQDRANLSTDDKTSLIKSATTKAHKRYDVLNLGIDDEDKLDETYDLQVLVKKTKRAHYKYDLHDVFTIVFPDETDETQITKTVDLYDNYHTLTPEEVARSNRWYKEWAADTWIAENLSHTYEFLQNNTQEDLWVKVCETYDNYKAAEQGGPLFFILLMKHLLSDSEAAAEALNNRVRTFKIQSVKGEDIFRIVSLLRGAVRRLKHIAALPQDIVKITLEIMQTSSVDEFNQHFHQLAQERKRDATWKRTTTTSITVEEIFLLAESIYRDMLENDTWSGISTTGTESAFLTANGKLTCFNCGGPHTVGKCPKPKDQKKINANRQAFIKNRGGSTNNRNSNENTTSSGTTSNHKFRPPLANEKNKRVIEGKPMWYHWKTRRWLPDNRQKAGTESQTPAPATTPGNAPGVNHTDATVKTSNKKDEDDGAKKLLQASLANTNKSISQALTAFTNDLMEHYV